MKRYAPREALKVSLIYLALIVSLLFVGIYTLNTPHTTVAAFFGYGGIVVAAYIFVMASITIPLGLYKAIQERKEATR